MKNKNIIIWIIGFIIFFILVYLGYNELSSRYNENEKNNNKGISDSLITGEEGKTEDTKAKAVDFTVYDEDGKEVKLSDYKGTPVVLNYWASWCGPCQSEMPLFKEANNKYGDNVKILMINMTDGQRETAESAKKFMVDNEYDMLTLYDKDLDFANKYNVASIPRTVFIDKEGFVTMERIGIVNEEFLEAMIERIKK
ncbi:TlpA disulfide reductase family protein [Clostridium sp. UBA5712]|uniref:TlpA family protein disulfide reductase n=1 Tax=Clostridium sp. UBA5712 TaxID=1946368 RepID=UPI00321809BB